jgi:hypothetical protein
VAGSKDLAVLLASLAVTAVSGYGSKGIFPAQAPVRVGSLIVASKRKSSSPDGWKIFVSIKRAEFFPSAFEKVTVRVR